MGTLAGSACIRVCFAKAFMLSCNHRQEQAHWQQRGDSLCLHMNGAGLSQGSEFQPHVPLKASLESAPAHELGKLSSGCRLPQRVYLAATRRQALLRISSGLAWHMAGQQLPVLLYMARWWFAVNADCAACTRWGPLP